MRIKERSLLLLLLSHGPPSTIVCKLMNLTEAFLTENHLEVRIRGRKEGHEIGNLEYH